MSYLGHVFAKKIELMGVSHIKLFYCVRNLFKYKDSLNSLTPKF